MIAEEEDSVGRSRQALQEAIEALAAAWQRRSSHQALLSWLRRFPDALRFRPASGHVRGVIARNGDPYAFEAILEALRAETTVQEATQDAPQPLQPRPTMFAVEGGPDAP